jgi:hypothetical protein
MENKRHIPHDLDGVWVGWCLPWEIDESERVWSVRPSPLVEVPSAKRRDSTF